MVNRNYYRNLFILSDLFGSCVAWSLFFFYRKIYVESLKYGFSVSLSPNFRYFLGLICIPLFWIMIHYASGAYSEIRRRTIPQNVIQLFTITLAGTLVIFFAVILDDTVISYLNYYKSLLVLFGLQFSILLLSRTVILYFKNKKIQHHQDFLNTLIIGRDERIRQFTSDNREWLNKSGLNIKETIPTVWDGIHPETPGDRQQSIDKLSEIITKKKITDIIILVDPLQPELLENILLQTARHDVFIRISPDLYPLIKHPVKSNSIFQSPVLELSKDLPPAWHLFFKTISDMLLSALAMIILSPLILFLAIAIKLTSRGPVIYSHIRIGKNGKPFHIYKFRSMYIDSETNGPQLASRNDKRITAVGRFMRKRRLDEIPNFINVLKGEMSLVGPRPERNFYIEQIIPRAPQYARLHLVKPGITSWGQVKYGYAENVDEMIKRMRFDLVYIDNMSLYVDLQILIKTIATIFRGQGV